MNKRIKKEWIPRGHLTDSANKNLEEFPRPFRHILFNRGIDDLQSARDFLSANQDFYDPFLLSGMEKAVERIITAIRNHEKILIFGDYDVDGITAASILIQVIRKLNGFANVYIPSRFEEGYGLSRDAIDGVIAINPNLLITVDCGIRSLDEVEIAHRHQIDVIITDHHLPTEKLPDAISVICAKKESDHYPYKELAGVGIAYKLADALLRTLAIKWVNIEEWLDLVAIGTVADVAPLDGENRVLVNKGIEKIRENNRVGIAALCKVSGINSAELSSYHIGYRLGPRLNAAGRLSSAITAFNLLNADSMGEAIQLATMLDIENRERQSITKIIQKEVENHIDLEKDKWLVSSFAEEYNEGVLGLAASRLTDSFYRPAVIGNIKDQFIKASCRSVPEVNITEALDGCSHLLERYGGHAMAAGLTIKQEHLDEFLQVINSLISDQLGGQTLTPKIFFDTEVVPYELDEELLKYIKYLEPTGSMNPSPLFVIQGVSIHDLKFLGETGEHCRFFISLNDDNEKKKRKLSVIAFGFSKLLDLHEGSLVDLLFAFEENFYNGYRNLQLNARDIRIHETGTIDF